MSNKDTNVNIKENKEQYKSPEARLKVGKISGIIGIVCNILLAVSKLIVGIIASSVSIIADSLNNITDAASAVVTLIGFKLAEKPADKEHPYGHARFEYLSGLAIAVMMLVIGLELIKSSAEKILNPTAVKITAATAIVLILSIIVKILLFVMNSRLGKKINSKTLIATAQDSRNDAIITSSVLVAGIIELVLGYKIDGITGFVVAVFIIISGIDLVKETISPLIGEGANEELQNTIMEHIMQYDRILGCHDLMVHDYGPGKRFASIHVEMDKDEDNLLCHELIDNIERECQQLYGVHLVIHYDPVVINDEELNRLKKTVLAILRVKDERISIHDFRMVPGNEHTNLIFDIELPMDLAGSEDSVKKALDNALKDLNETTYYTVITFDLN